MIADRLLADAARDHAIGTRAAADCAAGGSGAGDDADSDTGGFDPPDCDCAASSLDVEEAEGQFALAWVAIGAEEWAEAGRDFPRSRRFWLQAGVLGSVDMVQIAVGDLGDARGRHDEAVTPCDGLEDFDFVCQGLRRAEVSVAPFPPQLV